MKNINWAVLGTGVIANEMALALKKNGKNIYAVGNRTHEKAVIFAEKYGIFLYTGCGKHYGQYYIFTGTYHGVPFDLYCCNAAYIYCNIVRCNWRYEITRKNDSKKRSETS